MVTKKFGLKKMRFSRLVGKLTILGSLALASAANAQIPDLLNALDAGGRAMGMGGSLYGTGSDTHSTLNNPAGLGFVTQRQVSMTFRNLPGSSTQARNDFRRPDLSTDSESGDIGATHMGYVAPMGKGALGISYTTGGYIRDQRTGVGDLRLDAGTSIRNYRELLKAKIDYFTVGYGAGNRGGDLTYGASIVVASTYVRNRQTYDLVSAGQANPATPLDRSGTGSGVGVVVGAQLVPKSQPNLVVGASLRTPIDLKGNDRTALILDQIPGELELSAAMRKERGDDYMIIGGSLGRTFGADYTQVLQRKGTIFGSAGVEYNKLQGNARIPLRLGYAFSPSQGAGFKDRSGLTVGVGYRPLDKNFGIDLRLGLGSGSYDRALSITYKLN